MIRSTTLTALSYFVVDSLPSCLENLLDELPLSSSSKIGLRKYDGSQRCCGRVQHLWHAVRAFSPLALPAASHISKSQKLHTYLAQLNRDASDFTTSTSTDAATASAKPQHTETNQGGYEDRLWSHSSHHQREDCGCPHSLFQPESLPASTNPARGKPGESVRSRLECMLGLLTWFPQSVQRCQGQ